MPQEIQDVEYSIVPSVRRRVEPPPAKEDAPIPEGVARVMDLLNEYDEPAVKTSEQIRNYVTNRLIIETQGKIVEGRLRALEMLGKISDVALFTERREVTITNQTKESIEVRLREKLDKLLPQTEPGMKVEDALMAEVKRDAVKR